MTNIASTPPNPQPWVVAITGAGSGIGAALAQAYGAQGAELALADVRPERLAELAGRLRGQGVRVLAHAFDVADEAAWQGFVQAIAAEFGTLHVLINNAGVALADTVAHMPTADAKWLMDINFWGVFHGSRATLPLLGAAASNSASKPCIVNISSVFAFVSMPTQSAYNASKAAVRAFSDSLREELRPPGIGVLCVHPGGIKTRIAQDARVGDLAGLAPNASSLAALFELNAPNTPEYAATRVLRAQQRGQTRLRIGADAVAGDWLQRLFPAQASRWFSALIQSKAKP